MLYSRSLLVFCFKYSSMYMSTILCPYVLLASYKKWISYKVDIFIVFYDIFWFTFMILFCLFVSFFPYSFFSFLDFKNLDCIFLLLSFFKFTFYLLVFKSHSLYFYSFQSLTFWNFAMGNVLKKVWGSTISQPFYLNSTRLLILPSVMPIYFAIH